MMQDLFLPLQIYLLGFVISLFMAMLINTILKVSQYFSSKN